MTRSIAGGLMLAAALALVGSGARAADVIVSNFGTNVFGVPYIVGVEQGIFAAAGSPVTGAMSGGGGGSVVRNLMANALPFGEVATTAAMAAQQAGLDLVIVSTAAHAFGDVWLTLPNSPVHDIHDWIGRRVAFTSPKSISEAYILMQLEQAGIPADQVHRVATGGYAQGLTMLDTGGVDVAMAGAPLIYLKKGKYRELMRPDDVLPPMMVVVCVTTRAYAKAHPDTIRAVLEGRRRAVQWIYAHPKEAGAMMAKAYHLDEAIGQEVVEDAVKVKDHVWTEGAIDMKEILALQKGMALTGLKVDDVDWGKLIDASYLPRDLQAGSP